MLPVAYGGSGGGGCWPNEVGDSWQWWAKGSVVKLACNDDVEPINGRPPKNNDEPYNEPKEEGVVLEKNGCCRAKLLVEGAKKQLRLAALLVAVGILQQCLQVISIKFVGYLGELPLSSASRATSFASVSGFSVMRHSDTLRPRSRNIIRCRRFQPLDDPRPPRPRPPSMPQQIFADPELYDHLLCINYVLHITYVD
ncbi:hypothetical protein Nepgr_017033 [Nepenthes gracilis]|uniref:Uncharacterized protein n=1 Tax=Nepenthes gracilis TaxID=150966 RepID=A0AAD3XRT7_NEPGR|nr:hypothetical protein Nepgr_017033 [Nepenthes gracilis]